jgi:hypothetical protein
MQPSLALRSGTRPAAKITHFSTGWRISISLIAKARNLIRGNSPSVRRPLIAGNPGIRTAADASTEDAKRIMAVFLKENLQTGRE